MNPVLKSNLLLLLWFAALFLWILVSHITDHGIPARTVKTQAAVREIAGALSRYRQDLGRWPAGGKEGAKVDVSGDLLQALLGIDIHGLNARQTAYLEPAPAKNGKGGLVGTSPPYSLIDAWGHPYITIMGGGDGEQMSNPDLQNTDADIRRAAVSRLDTGGSEVIVYSCGEDGIDGTGDDFVSWRQSRNAAPPSWQDRLPSYAGYWGCVAIIVAGIGWKLMQFLRFLRDGFEARAACNNDRGRRRFYIKRDEF